MIQDEKTMPEPQGDSAADLIHDLANGPPAKGLETIKAASDALDADGEQEAAAQRRSRIQRRAYELWEADGGHHGSHADFWYKAEAELAREDG